MKKITRLILSAMAVCLAVLIAAVPMARSTAVAFEEADKRISDLDREISTTVEYIKKSLGAKNDTELAASLTAGAGAGCDWYTLALTRLSYPVDTDAYADALEKKLASGEVSGAVERQRCALILCALGRSYDYAKVLDETSGKLGLMSLVFGLHIADNSDAAANVTASELIEQILSSELEGGGWAIIGRSADIDTTAMTVQALARHKELPDVQDAIDRALVKMSEKQCQSGGFSSYGTENAESTAQVIIALCSLGLDPETDRSFAPMLEELLSYRVSDGSFSHIKGGVASVSATSQALCALVSMKLMLSDVGGFYETHKKLPASTPSPDVTEPPTTTAVTPAVTDDPAEPDEPNISDSSDVKEHRSFDIKLVATLAVLAAAAIVSIILFLRSGRRRRDILIVLIIAALVCVAVNLVNIESVDGHFSMSTTVEPEIDLGSVTFSVRCDTVKNIEGIPSDGVVIETVGLSLGNGESVFDLLDRAARMSRVTVVEKGGYVSSIANISEQSYGDLSGWVFFVNGEMPSVGCREYFPKDGDVIEWHYTRDLGKDITPEYSSK